MKCTDAKLPDPWLFDSEALLRELDHCRETVLQILGGTVVAVVTVAWLARSIVTPSTRIATR
jgi:hypothetical protein